MSPAVTLAQAVGARERQEDRCAVRALDGLVAVVLADGMGGHADGDLAARDAVLSAMESLVARSHLLVGAEPDPNTLVAVLDDAVSAAVAAVKPLGRRAGCTLLIALVWPDRAVLRQVGDSMAYLRTPPTGIHPLTRPQVYGRSTLLSSIPEPAMQDTVLICGFTAADQIVICSDGLNPSVIDGSTAPHLVRAQLAKADPRQDNVTAVVVEPHRIPTRRLAVVGEMVEVSGA